VEGDRGDALPSRLGTRRFEAFSDGVFAIAATLLVLDLAVGASGSSVERVVDGWPSYLAYIVSFLTIGAVWIGHAVLTERLVQVDSAMLRLNLVLLLVVSFLPFPTRLVASSLGDLEGQRVYVTLYGITLLAMRLALWALDQLSVRSHLVADGLEDLVEVGRPTTLVATYAIAILIGVALPVVAVGLYFGLALYVMVPYRELVDLFSRRPPPYG
jgi:uncharacterized membrane protein